MSIDDPVINSGKQSDRHQTPTESLASLLSDGYHPSAGVGNSRDGLGVESVLRDVLSAAMHSSGAEGGFILVLDEGSWPSHWFVRQGEQGRLFSATHARTIVERGIVDWAVQHPQGAVVDDLAGDLRWLLFPHSPSSAGPGSALCIPLLVHARVVAVLALVHRKSGYFRSHHLGLLQSVADRSALSVDNARLYEIVRRQAEEMTALSEMALNISADQPLGRLLDTVVAQAMDLLRCQGAGIFLWRENDAKLELVSAYDPEIDLRGLRVAAGEGLAGRVFETGDPLALDEVEDWPNSATPTAKSDVSSGLPAPAVVAVPLVWQGQSLGVVVGTDRTRERGFTHSDQHLLALLANQAAPVIASVQMHEQTSRRLHELTFLNKTIQDITATLDLDEIFAVLTQRVMDLLGIGACSIALVDRDTNELVFRMASGGGSESVIGERVPWGKGIVGAAAQSGRPITVSEVARDDRFFEEIDRRQAGFTTHSILAVPMISRGQVVGVVEGLNKRGGFDSEDERLLGALASLAASVVENANLVSAQRELEVLRENLTHMIVHDLRSPVGTISNSLQLLERLLEDIESDQADQLVDIASRATQRLLNLVDSLLDISRLEAGQELTHLRPVSVQTLIQSAVDQLALYVQRKRMRLHVECPDNLPVVMADSGMLERVFINLLSNAIKFTPAGGEVGIRAKVKGDLLYVRVRDNGLGIAPEFRKHVFDKFARARDREGMSGFGLGLAFCRMAVEAHGGQIWVEASPEQGSTFIFTLPLDSASDPPSEN
jgi:signal transduction histidine kinase